jgi:L-lactate dehydrogenase complex protein LldE
MARLCRGESLSQSRPLRMSSPMPPSPTPSQTAAPRKRVGLFVTCLVDLFRPAVGFAAVKLLEDAGCEVEAPLAQTCCGQPAYNSGDRTTATTMAHDVIELFSPYDYVVAPSGSCAGMLKKHYPPLFWGDALMELKAQAFASKVYELTSFLTDVMGVVSVEAEFPATAAYHDSCSNLREMGVSAQPRMLLRSVKGLKLVEMEDTEACCGFGGLFSVKFPEISEALASRKIEQAADAGAEVLLGGDLGCLMSLAGRMTREGRAIEVRHVAEALAGVLDAPPLGSPAHEEIARGDGEK